MAVGASVPRYLISRTNVLPQVIAVIRAGVPQRELPRIVPAFCGEVWEFARTGLGLRSVPVPLPPAGDGVVPPGSGGVAPAA